MRCQILAVSLVLSTACLASAQQDLPSAPQPSSWQGVEALRPGTSLHVNSATRHMSCRVQEVGPDSIACREGANSVFQRSEIKSIKSAHRVRSMLVGSALGFGVGAIIGAAAHPGCSAQQKSSFLGCFNVVSRADLAFGLGAGLAVVGAPVGYFTDFTRSTVYKAR